MNKHIEKYRKNLELCQRVLKECDSLNADCFLGIMKGVADKYMPKGESCRMEKYGRIVVQYGDFDYEELRGGFERSVNNVYCVELDKETGIKRKEYTMYSNSYGETINGPCAEYREDGSLKDFRDFSAIWNSDDYFCGEVYRFTRNGDVSMVSLADYCKHLSSDFVSLYEDFYWKKGYTDNFNDFKAGLNDRIVGLENDIKQAERHEKMMAALKRFSKSSTFLKKNSKHV